MRAESLADFAHALARGDVGRVERDQLRQGFERARVVLAGARRAGLRCAARARAAAVSLVAPSRRISSTRTRSRTSSRASYTASSTSAARGAQAADLEHPLDQLARVGVVRRRAAAPLRGGRERARGSCELIEIDLAEPHLEVDRLGLRRGLEPVLEQRGELLLAPFARVELLERARGVLVRGIELEDALVVADGLAGLVDDLFADEGDLVEEIDAARGRRSCP